MSTHSSLPTVPGILRLVISSANLGRYDGKINNQSWVCDFALAKDAHSAAMLRPRHELLDEISEWQRAGSRAHCERGMREVVRDMEVADLADELLRVRRAGAAEFGSQLRHFLRRLLYRAAPSLCDKWMTLLDKYDLVPPAGEAYSLTN